ncbi:MinD/ParA family protein [Virgibacillus proomii]|jgi:flagellar biosynthesis protein FlhG|uniref:MinD/ParA family protein n=1 Tax=Virgibacillus proomii TaxID=84407 RepID=UPI0009870806|nr:MinD/ParA family protein [Virgibacillus proomii]
MKNDQASGLRRRLHPALSKQKHAKTVAVISGKGGVGKSNITLNLSLELLNQKKRVLIIDMDIGMGNIDILLGLQVQKTIIDMFERHLSIQEIIETGPNNLHYVAAGSGLSNIFSMNQATKDFFFQQYQTIIPTYDYIIFDMGAGITQDTLTFILAADECIVITTPEPTSITDGYSMIKHIVSYNPSLPIQVIMNRSQSEAQGRKSLERFQAVVRQFLQLEIKLLGSLPEDKAVTKAVIRQTPFIFLYERAPITKAIKRLVLTYMEQACGAEQTNVSSFLNKLKQLWTER